MSITLEELQILITTETAGLRRDLDSVRKNLGDLSRSTSNASASMKKAFVAVAAAIATLGIAKYVKDGIDGASHLESAMMGLKSIVEGQGRSFSDAKKYINEYIQDGLVPLTDAVTAYKNLASRGYSDEQIKNVMNRLKDAASFGRQASYTLGAAVSSATEGLKNENSILVDNAGVTKNVAKMWDEYAATIGKTSNNLSQQEKIQAEVNGIMEETKFQVGDAAKYTDTYAGKMAALNKTLSDIQGNIGSAFIPILSSVLPYIQAIANAISRITEQIAIFMKALFGVNSIQSAGGIGADKAADSQDNLGDSLDKTASKAKKAAKEAKNSIAGFDEINQLTDPSGGKGGEDTAAGASSISMPELDTETIPTKIQEMVDRVKAILSTVWDGVADGAMEYGGKIKEAFSGIGEAFQPVIAAKEPIIAAFGEIGETFVRCIEGFLKPAAEYITLDFIPKIVMGFTKSFAPVFTDVAVFSVQEFAKTFENVTKRVSDLFQGTWLPSMDKLKNTYLEAFSKMASATQSYLDGTLKPFVDYTLNDFIVPLAAKIQQTLVPLFTDVLVVAIKEYTKNFEWSAGTVNSIYKTVIEPTFNLIKKIVTDVLSNVEDLWKKHGESIMTSVTGIFEGIRETFQKLWDEVLEPIIKPLLETLDTLWEESFKGLIEQGGEFTTNLIESALEILNKFVIPLVGYIVDRLGPTFVTVFNLIVKTVGESIKTITTVLKSLYKVFDGVIDFLMGVFTADWDRAWQGIGNIFSGIWELISNNFKLALNGMISMVNVFIRFWNSIELKVPEVDMGPLIGKFGGYTIGTPKIPQIHALAKGGITNGPTLAMIGDNFGGQEVVSPLSDLKDMIAGAVGTAVMAAMQMSGGGQQSSGSSEFVLNLEGTPVARILLPFIINEQQRVGSSAIIRPI